jgi:hypothetical protein
MKSDLAIRPIFHQEPDRIEAHVFVAFPAYCLYVTLARQLKSLASRLGARNQRAVESPKQRQGAQCRPGSHFSAGGGGGFTGGVGVGGVPGAVAGGAGAAVVLAPAPSTGTPPQAARPSNTALTQRPRAVIDMLCDQSRPAPVRLLTMLNMLFPSSAPLQA